LRSQIQFTTLRSAACPACDSTVASAHARERDRWLPETGFQGDDLGGPTRAQRFRSSSIRANVPGGIKLRTSGWLSQIRTRSASDIITHGSLQELGREPPQGGINVPTFWGRASHPVYELRSWLYAGRSRRSRIDPTHRNRPWNRDRGGWEYPVGLRAEQGFWNPENSPIEAEKDGGGGGN
jgi:hypothetical protein